LTKKFDQLTAVDRLTLTIDEGEVFGFLGPNGAGKTTTVRLLSALIAPTAGTARIGPYTLGKDDQEIRRVTGILTETPGLYERLSAWRNLEIFAELYEVEDVPGQVEKYLRFLGLWDRRNDPAGSFSKGMRQKLAIARALLHEPRILYLDEPTAGLDPEAARLVRDFVGDLREEGRTIFICTHNLDEADRLCDRVAVFKTQLRVVDTPGHLRAGGDGRQVVFHLGQPAATYLDMVQALDVTRTVKADENKLVLLMDEPEAENPGVVRALVDAGADIQFIGEIRHSLEDAYLAVVRQEEPA
jgi:ABC-2 type transport system ATP-binding protein